MNGLRFDGLRSTHPRRERCRVIVLHFTGGAGDPAQVYRTLRSRKGPRSPDGLSVHDVQAVDGEIVHMASRELVCLHAGMANPWSHGIEVISPGIASGAAYLREKAAGVRRDVYEARMRGARRSVRFLDFTAAQTTALLAYVEELLDFYRLPRRVPVDEHGALLTRTMTEAKLADFEGVLGHFHVSSVKIDPGTRPLERLLARWR